MQHKDETTKKRKRTDSEISKTCKKRFKFEDGTAVPADVKKRTTGKGSATKHFIIHNDGTETQIFTDTALCRKRQRAQEMNEQRFKYENGKQIPAGAKIIFTGKGFDKKIFIINEDKTQTQVYTSDMLKNLKQAKPKAKYFYQDGKVVSAKAKISTELNGAIPRHFVINEDKTRTRVYTHKVNKFKYADGTNVAADVTIRTEGVGKSSKHFLINQDKTETQVFKANSFFNMRFRYRDGSDARSMQKHAQRDLEEIPGTM